MREESIMSPYTARKTWILVCDGGHAKFYENHGANDSLHQIRKLNIDIPKAGDLITGERGRNRASSNSTEGHAYSQPNPRQQQKEDFLKQVAVTVNRNLGGIFRLVVAAPPKALHILRRELSPQAQQKIIAEIPKDLTKSDERNLPQFLAEYLNIREPVNHGFDSDYVRQSRSVRS